MSMPMSRQVSVVISEDYADTITALARESRQSFGITAGNLLKYGVEEYRKEQAAKAKKP